VSLGAFGWRRVETPEGPTFEMLGLRGAPTGAVVGAPSWEEVNLDLLEEIVRWVEESRERERRLRGESSEDTS
jgi:hypothetical protein